MPILADITIKAADGSTDVTYTALQGAAGPGNPAIFRNETVGSSNAQRPSLLVRATDNANKTSRRVRVDFSWPIVSEVGGVQTFVGRMAGEATVVIPQSQGASVIEEQAAQFSNLVGSALIRECFSTGYAPRS